MKSNSIDISIVIPFYKGENFIYDLLMVIDAAYRKETNILVEVIIVIDSMETSIEQLQQTISINYFQLFPIVCIKNLKNSGVAASRNAGIAIANGRFLLLIDQDDKIEECFFQELVKIEYNNYDFILFNGSYFFVNKNKSVPIFIISPKINLRNIILNDIIRSPGQVLMKKDLLEKYRFPLPQKFAGADDKFCWIRLFFNYPTIKTYYHRKLLYIAQIHDNNVSNNYMQLYFSCLELWSDLLIKEPNLLLTNKKIIQQSIYYYKYETKKLVGYQEIILGFIASIKYHINLNKIIVFLLKKLAL